MSVHIRLICGIVSFASLMSLRGDEISPSTTTNFNDPIVRLLGVSENVDPQSAQRIARFLNERKTVARFLQKRKVVATEEAVDRRLEDIERVLIRQGKTLDDALQNAGFTADQLREALQVPIAWKAYLQTVVTEQTIENQFDSARQRYDGSTVDLAQIVLLPQSETATAEVRKMASTLAQRVKTGEISFEAAVQKYSQSPSAANGGRLNTVRFVGDVPDVVAEWAFSSDIGQVSKPLESSIGYHIVKVLDRKQGDRSLEDARLQVIADISDRLWAEALKSENGVR